MRRPPATLRSTRRHRQGPAVAGAEAAPRPAAPPRARSGAAPGGLPRAVVSACNSPSTGEIDHQGRDAARGTGGAAGVSAAVVSLMKGVLRIMMLSQLKSLAAVVGVALVFVLASALGVSLLPRPARSNPIGQAQEKPEEKKAPAESPPPKNDRRCDHPRR